MTINTRPLISFIVIAYNQEKYIKEAIEGAFSQTYEPLEIVLSDDNSPDNTFEIMKKMADEYEGPHTVVLNKNTKNMRLIGHMNKAVQLSRGRLFVMNAGDDISYKERVSNVYQAWVNSDYKAKMIVSSHQCIALNGEFIKKPIVRDLVYKDASEFIFKYPDVDGAACAYDRDIFEKFGSLNVTSLEDRTMAFRAILIGNVVFIPSIDILYRDGGMSKINQKNWNIKYHGKVYMQLLYDLDNSTITGNEKLQLIKDYALSYLIWIHRAKSYLDSNKKINKKLNFIYFLLFNFTSSSFLKNIKMIIRVIMNKI